ncbi:unnamed protein product [Gemmata massiliana]|uniref:DNA primase/polymerase bifunctional N-terminal domain-containing protein n=1 Tax=Gemmata massiliana TaxID=1210884 RepID=A0A6P2CZ59_9BACT|nr:hypothetical protein [Gemmata massiliana]VTR92500.1 unnamed protein product [Gemmata massiliana]
MITEAVERYRARGWCMVPVHRPAPDAGTCSCGRADCAKPGKHPDARFWPDGSAAPEHFVGRNLGIKLGPVSGHLADVDLDCAEAVAAGPYLLPATRAAFGCSGRTTRTNSVRSSSPCPGPCGATPRSWRSRPWPCAAG